MPAVVQHKPPVTNAEPTEVLTDTQRDKIFSAKPDQEIRFKCIKTKSSVTGRTIGIRKYSSVDEKLAMRRYFATSDNAPIEFGDLLPC